MNEVIDCILTRRSVKKYDGTMPAESDVKAIAEAGSYAASGMGRQSPVIIAVTNKALRDRLSAINARILGREGIDPFYNAPVVYAVLADENIPTHVYDGSLVLGNMMLAAHSLGLSSCWIHRAKETFESAEGKAILEECGLVGDYEGIGFLIVGYSAGEAKPAAPRKDGYIRYIK